MIYSILQSYLNILLIVAGVSLLLLAGGLYFIFKRSPTSTAGCQLKARWHDTTRSPDVSCQRKLASSESSAAQSTPDITAIAGDDLMATQLDLARAYIETGKKHLATAILKQVLTQGSEAEQQEAQVLLEGAK